MASLDDSQPVIPTRHIVQNLISEVAINNLKPEKQNSTREVKSQAEAEPGRDSDSTGHFFESKRRADKSMSAIEERTEKSQSSSNCITKSLETANFEAAAAYQSIESSQKTIPQVCAFDVDQPSTEKILHNGSESLIKDISQNNVSAQVLARKAARQQTQMTQSSLELFSYEEEQSQKISVMEIENQIACVLEPSSIMEKDSTELEAIVVANASAQQDMLAEPRLDLAAGTPNFQGDCA